MTEACKFDVAPDSSVVPDNSCVVSDSSNVVLAIASENSCACEGRLVLLRHGQTAWSVSGQHTGRTDLPLTEVGVEQAKEAGARLQCAFTKGFDEDCVLVSPLRRAQQTAQFAGFASYTICDSALEWDYGAAAVSYTHLTLPTTERV